MVVIKQMYCDLCGAVVKHDYLILRGVYHSFVWEDYYREHKKIIICEECIRSLQAAAKEDRKIEKRDDT